MQDDRQKNQDDDFENDLDIDDEPDDDDLDAEWESLDADEDEDADEPSAEPDQKSAGKKQPRADKTFLQKNFPLVVGGIVITGGVLFLLPALLRQPMPSAPKADALPADLASNTAEIEDLQSGLPPMPTPIDGQSEGAPPVSAEGEDLAAVEAAQAPLLPMPEPAGDEVTATEPSKPGEIAVVEGGLVEAAPALSNEPAPLPSEEAPAAEATAQTDASSLSEVESVSEDVLLDEPSVAPVPDAPAAVSPVLPEAASAAAVSPPPLEAAPEDATLRQAASDAAAKAKDAEKALSDAEEKARAAEAKAAKLEESVKSNEKTIAELEKTIATLKKDAAEAKSRVTAPSGSEKADAGKPAAGNMETAKKDTKKVEPSSTASSSLVIAPVVGAGVSKPKADSVAEAPKSRKEEPVSRSASVAPAPASENWVLRSAQPGRAVIAKASTDDLQNIAVGDTVKGLGRIMSIQMEGGRWVVRGTQGEVSR